MKKEIEILNPWWFDEKWYRKDKHLKAWKENELKWVPKWLKEISLKPFSLNFVIGPRQVGKTTGLKLLIKRLVEEGRISVNSIVYVDVGLITTLENFKNLLLDLEGYRFILLDEITSLDGWWKILRACIDAGIFDSSVLIVTGSTCIKIKIHAELFPGRYGKGKIINVLPLSFPDLKEVVYGKKEVPEVKLQKLFEKYKLYGGFPLSLNEGDIAFEEIIKSLEGEIVKLDLSIETTSKIISSLLRKIPSALSYQSLGSDVGVSYKTIEHYLEMLKGLYVLNIAYWKHNTQVSFRKEKKIFFRDPFILRSFSFWTGEKFLESALYENIVQEHLYRNFGEIYYYRNKYEIDCMAGDLKVEVKAGKPHRRYPRNVVVLEEEDIPRFLMEISSYISKIK